MRCPLHKPLPEDVGVTSVNSKRQRNYHFEAEQFDTAAVFVSVKATYPAFVECAAFEDGRNVARYFSHEAPEQFGNLVFGHPNAYRHGVDRYPPLGYYDR